MKKLQGSKKFSIFLIFLGAAIIATGIVASILAENDLLGGSFLGYGAGIGSVTISFGIGFLIRSKMPSEEIRRQKTENKDERSVMIREKSAYNTHNIMTIALALPLLFYRC